MNNMKIIRHIIKSDSDYIEFDIVGGDDAWNIGDQVWFSQDGTKMELDILSLDDDDVREELEEYIGEELVEEIAEVLEKAI